MRRTEQLISMLANDAGIIAQMGIFLAGAWFAITGKGAGFCFLCVLHPFDSLAKRTKKDLKFWQIVNMLSG